MAFLPSTLVSKRDYGIKIARKGYDVRYASDNQLLYNSSFPLLQIVEIIDSLTVWEVVNSGSYDYWDEYSGTMTTKYRHSVKWLHGLGYPPMFVGTDEVSWDLKYLYYTMYFEDSTEYNSFVSGGYQVDASGIVIAVDISTDVEYPYLDIGTEVEYGQTYDYGLKHILTDDVNTKDPNNLGINANVQSMMVVAVKVALASNGANQYKPPIDPDMLLPFCFADQNSNGIWNQVYISAQNPSGYRPPTDVAYYYTLDGILNNAKISLVLVRQPMISSVSQDSSVNF